MATLKQDAYDALVCKECIGDPDLQALVIREGRVCKCSYCNKKGKAVPIPRLADVVEAVYLVIYERTSNEEEHRKGDGIIDLLAGDLQVENEIAEDIREVMADKHFDKTTWETGEEGEYDPESMYESKALDTEDIQNSWSRLCELVRAEDEINRPTIELILDRIFDGLADHQTWLGASPIITIGPHSTISSLFRARVFYKDNQLEEAVKRPDKELAPPPPTRATAGRMNRAGTPVFYGAETKKVAIAEVRPPVGSKVVTACFHIIRPLQVLDLEVLSEIYGGARIFNPIMFRKQRVLHFFVSFRR